MNAKEKLKKRTRLLKISKYIGLSVMGVGFLTILGTAGSMDYTGIDIYTLLICVAVGICVCAVGFFTAQHCDYQLNEIISELVLYKAGKIEVTEEKQHNIA